jgi:hypothetical protein
MAVRRVRITRRPRGLSAQLTAARRCTRRYGRRLRLQSTRSTGHRLFSQPSSAAGRPAARAGLASPNSGSALLKRTGADARIISMVNTNGFE